MSTHQHPPAESGWPEHGAMIAGRYRLGERIGEGGMAAVYLATRADDGLEVAVKVLRPEIAVDPEVVRRFLQEARAASLIRHPKIVGILDFGFTGEGVAFLVMERLVGDDLADVLERDGPFTWQRLAPLALDICAALGAAHGTGIVHRDVKPENCFLLTGPDGHPQVKVLDFGIAKDVGGSLPDRPQTATGMLCGSPEYIAPEVIMGKVAEVGSDIYALGITLYELLTGSHPFAGAEFGEMLAAHVQRPPPSFASRGIEVPP
ncbi:MAG TPA: serine/threonine protein kinase, partial [Nannocystis exedens]|nr:serine/threonine protein kinase [Nannocystis exedens]